MNIANARECASCKSICSPCTSVALVGSAPAHGFAPSACEAAPVGERYNKEPIPDEAGKARFLVSW